MKSLRQLLRRRSHSSPVEHSKTRRAATRPQSGRTTRRLSTQALEQRQLLAGDLSAAHNYWNGYDVNQDLRISPVDALGVINYLSETHGLGEQVSAEGEDVFQGRKVDVNGDGYVTPSDALGVINALSRGEQMEPLVEFFLSARDENDNELVENNGVLQVQTGIENSFFIEVAYSDLRATDPFDPLVGPLGAFSFYQDIGVSQGGILTPVLNEIQQFVFREEIRDVASGDLVITEEGSTAQATISRADLFANGFANSVRDALVNTFGYSASDIAVTQPADLASGNDVGLQVEFTGDQFKNVDVPDLTFTANFDINVDIVHRPLDPFVLNNDPTPVLVPNSALIVPAMDFNSRTLPNQQQFYGSLPRGSFDVDAGFVDIGGIGGIPNIIEVVDAAEGVNFVFDEVYPVDVFRIEVFIDQPISDSNPLVLDLNLGEGTDPLTLYGSDDLVPEDLIVADEDARLTISTGAVINTPPTLGTSPLSRVYSEDGTSDTINLLEDASDGDGDTLSVTGFSTDPNTISGLSLNGSALTVDPTAYNSLMAGAVQNINLTYSVTDGIDSVTQTLNITINGANDTPDVSGPISETRSENAPQFNINLLQNASDVDGDTLDAVNITQVGTEDNSGITVNDVTNTISVDPSAYSALEDGQEIVLTYSYDVTDGTDSVSTQVTITIEGDTPNRDPVVSAAVTSMLSEDDSTATINLLDNVTDPDGDVLAVQTGSLNLVSGDASGVMDNGNTLSVDPSAYNALPAGQNNVIEYTYTVVDGENGSASHSATITITGANDAPVVTSELSRSFTEDDAATTVSNLLDGASDPDTGDSLSVSGISLESGNALGITINDSSLSVDPTANNDLAANESRESVFTYSIDDTNNGSTTQRMTITITGVNDAPTVGDPLTVTVSEDDNIVNVDLLDGAADADTSDTLSVTNLSVSSPFSLSGSTLTFDPNAFNSLAASEMDINTFTYDISDGNGGSVPQSLTVTINGANDAPDAGADLNLTYIEDDAAETFSLLDGASDPDTNDVLSVSDLSVTGDTTGVMVNGNNVTVTPTAYGDLEDDQQITVTLTYNVFDGTDGDEKVTTITISGMADDPTHSGDITRTFDESDDTVTINLLEGASDPNDDPLFITNAVVQSGDSKGVTVNTSNSTLTVNPSAYADLEDNESETVVVSFDISDDEGNTVARTATITIEGRTINGSTIGGQLYIDHIENPHEVLDGGTPIRNGVHDDDEETLGGVTVRLKVVTPTGEAEIAAVMTDNDGNYAFENVEPGTYFVEYDIPESVQHTGSTRGQVVVGQQGGDVLSGPNLHAIGLVGVMQRLDLLAKTYINQGIINTGSADSMLAGGKVQLNADGTQQMFVAGEGFDAKFAEVVLNDARDAALLTIVDANDNVKSARLDLGQFIVTGDGMGVRFFGAMEDFNFTDSTEQLVADEFEDYRNAIDRIFAQAN